MLFYFGMELPNATSMHVVEVEVLLGGLSFALAARLLVPQEKTPHQPDRAIMRTLLETIHAEVVTHLQCGHNMLVPGDESGLVSKISLGRDGPDVVVEEIPPRGRTRRRYTITSAGKVNRSLIPTELSYLTHSDEQWREEAMTQKRLERLLAALRSKQYDRHFQLIEH